MRMKRKDTQLLVENWRNLLKGESIEGESTNEIFGLGKKDVSQLLSKKIDEVLQYHKDAIKKTETEIMERMLEKAKKEKPSDYEGVSLENFDIPSLKDYKQLLTQLVRARRANIVGGQILLKMKEMKSSSKKIKSKKFNDDLFKKLVTGKTGYLNGKLDDAIAEFTRNLEKTFNENFDASELNRGNVRDILSLSKLDIDFKQTMPNIDLSDVISSMIK